MMKTFIFSLLLLVLSLAGRAQPLPSGIFEALDAGEHQTVITYGTSVTILGQWATEVGLYFDAHYPGQVTFTNTACAGQTSVWGLENLQERVLDLHPDLVFLEFAINDAATKHGISTEDCRDNLDALVKRIRAQNPDVEIVLQTMDPAWDSPASAPKKYASDRPHLNDYYQVYRDFAAENNLPLIDNYPVWRKIMDENPELYHKMVPDGIHPGKDASREVAWPAVKLLLEKARFAAGSGETLPVWPDGKMPGSTTPETECLCKVEQNDAMRITNVNEPTLTLFPADVEGPAPAVIVCPGGAYEYCVADKEGTEVAEWLNSLGFHALVLIYRTPDNREGALQDMQRAVRTVRANADKWNIDPERVGCIGFSAGGNLCAKASNRFEEQTYAPVDGVDELSSRPDFAVLIYPAYLDQDGKLAQDLNLDADIPPTFIAHTEDDELFVPGSKLYAAALEEKEQPHLFRLYQTGGHGYGLRCELEAKAWPQEAGQWLSSILNP